MNQVHGMNNLSVEGRILIIQGRGPWNLNSIDQSVVEVPQELAGLYGEPWGVLLEFEGDSIFVPEARDRLIDIVKSDREKGRVATALVLRNCSTPQFITEHLGFVYESGGDAFASFEDLEGAKAWLQQMIVA